LLTFVECPIFTPSSQIEIADKNSDTRFDEKTSVIFSTNTVKNILARNRYSCNSASCVPHSTVRRGSRLALEISSNTGIAVGVGDALAPPVGGVGGRVSEIVGDALALPFPFCIAGCAVEETVALADAAVAGCRIFGVTKHPEIAVTKARANPIDVRAIGALLPSRSRIRSLMPPKLLPEKELERVILRWPAAMRFRCSRR
jgi:hypothetical protein